MTCQSMPSHSEHYGVQVFALHPVYLSLTAMAPDKMPHDLAQRIKEARVQLDKQDVDYEATLATKLTIAQDLFDQQGAAELEVH